jgi:hypothetical protein
LLHSKIPVCTLEKLGAFPKENNVALPTGGRGLRVSVTQETWAYGPDLALDWGSRGRKFESYRPDEFKGL